MMKQTILVLMISFLALASNAQIMFTKTGVINFNSKSTVEKIEATNKAVACKLNTTTGEVDFVVLIKSFVFANQLMQEHFNENYMESDKFPKASFKGKITNLADVNFTKDGVYRASVDGVLNIHGVDKKITVPGTITVKAGKASISTAFNVILADHKIDIPSAVKDKISKDIKVTVNCSLGPFKK